ncbi:MAG: LysR family transcriptional regulator [Pseudomonas sp.]
MSEFQRLDVVNTLLDQAGSALAAFVHSARLGGFARAAVVLGMTPSGVAKAVQRLEARVGVRLFARTTRSLGLTEAGRLLLPPAERILAAAGDAADALAQHDGVPRGRLRLSLAPAIGKALVLPTLTSFRERYPLLDLEIDFEGRSIDLAAAGVDVALRTGPLPDSRLQARALGRERLALCAAPAYVRRRGEPETLEALASHDLLRYRNPSDGRVRAWPLEHAQTLPETLVFSDPDALRVAVLAGLGIALMPGYVTAPAFAEGRLLPVLADACTGLRGAERWLLWPPGRQRLPKARAFINHVAELFAAQDADS